MDKPNLILVGTQKSGTTSLARILPRVSPDVFMAPRELRFWQSDSRYRNGEGVSDYLALFETATSPIVGEKSPAYSYSTKVAPRLAKHLPGTHILWIFRDPVRRAYSAWTHSVWHGKEWRSFELAVGAEFARGERRDPMRNYLARSRYIDQVRHYDEYFPPEQMHFLLFEEVRDDPVRALTPLLQGLGAEIEPRDLDEKQVHNAARPVRVPAAQWAALRLSGGPRLRSAVGRVNSRFAHPRDLDEELDARLRMFFAVPNEELQARTGLAIADWWNPRP